MPNPSPHFDAGIPSHMAQEPQVTWEELAEYAQAYSRQVGHISFPLGAEKLKQFVHDLYPNEFQLDEFGKKLVAANNGVLNFDFVGCVEYVIFHGAYITFTFFNQDY